MKIGFILEYISISFISKTTTEKKRKKEKLGKWRMFEIPTPEVEAGILCESEASLVNIKSSDPSRAI